MEVGHKTGIYDNYALDCYRNCQTYYFWRFVKQVVRVSDVKIAANFGSAIHLALEHWYRKGMTEEAAAEALDVFSENFKDDDPDGRRTVGRGLELLSNYFIRYKNEPFNVVATEVGGACELGDDYTYTVRLDLVVEWQDPRGIYGVDHKTSSSLSNLLVKPNNQITGYIFYLNQMYGETCLGYMINGIGVFKSDETIDKSAPKELSSKTGKWVYAKKKREVFIRMPTQRTKKELDDWEAETLHTISQIENSVRTGRWNKHAPHFCTAYRGRCQYLDLCLSQYGESVMENLVQAGVYEIRPWQPYQASPEKEGSEDE